MATAQMKSLAGMWYSEEVVKFEVQAEISAGNVHRTFEIMGVGDFKHE